jgi:hypothetical protein
MRHFQYFVISLCFGLSIAELLGPEARKEEEKNENEDEESSGGLDNAAKMYPEYTKALADAVNKEIISLQEYADAIRDLKDPKDENNKGISIVYLDK